MSFLAIGCQQFFFKITVSCGRRNGLAFRSPVMIDPFVLCQKCK